jgi:hypothetical protein
MTGLDHRPVEINVAASADREQPIVAIPTVPEALDRPPADQIGEMPG